MGLEMANQMVDLIEKIQEASGAVPLSVPQSARDFMSIPAPQAGQAFTKEPPDSVMKSAFVISVP